jgi:hypothetical protein
MSVRRMRLWSPVAALIVSALPSCGGGGGGGGGGPVAGPATLPPTTTTTTTIPAGGKPNLKFTLNRYSGKSPVTIAFDLCESTDSSGGKNLTYLADFDEGQGLTDQGSCQFQHRYRSGGVTVFDAKVAVRGAGGQQSEEVLKIKTYVDVSISVASTPCNKISATADLVSSSSTGGVRAMAEVDRVEFEAFDAGGRSVSKKNGSQQSSSRWVSGDWNTTVTNKLRVTATVFAQGVAGDDQPEQPRPGCQ